MSAIAGIYYLDARPVDRVDLERMIETLAHRGSDGSGVWNDNSVGLGHQMLWTTPESLHERLPLAKGGLTITADARIDNRDGLISLLGFPPSISKTISDSELILAAYERWDEHCPEKLLGDFAFAIWDSHKQQLFCARDHFGVKPFYYYSTAKLVIFATEIKALLCLPEVPRLLNETKIADHLTSTDIDKEITFYRGILRLPPAHSIRVGREGIRVQSYWSLDPSRELIMRSDAEYAEAFRELFTEAVRCRLRSAFPLGSMLSGGLDSSSVTCVARNLLAQSPGSPLHTFSAVFDEVTQCDERSFIEAVLAENNLESHYFHADQFSPLTDLDRVLWHLDEVSSAGNLYLNWCLYDAAQKKGVRIVLEGFDGDTTVSHGAGYLIELARARRWITLSREARGYARHFNQLDPWKIFWQHFERYGLNPRVRQSLSFGKRVKRALLRRARYPFVSRATDLPASAIVKQEFLQRINFGQRCQSLRTPRTNPLTERDIHHARLNWGVMSSALEKLNKTAGAFSMENRFPFWDKRLVEFCLALPANQKLHQGWNRMVMRRAMEGILPKEVQWRGGKADMTLSVEQGLLTFERERLEKTILRNSEIIADYLDTTGLHEAYRRFTLRSGTEEDGLTVWKAVSLALWLQSSVLEPRPQAIT